MCRFRACEEIARFKPFEKEDYISLCIKFTHAKQIHVEGWSQVSPFVDRTVLVSAAFPGPRPVPVTHHPLEQIFVDEWYVKRWAWIVSLPDSKKPVYQTVPL